MEAIFEDSFEGPSIADFWGPGDCGSGRYAPGAVAISEECKRLGKPTERIILREGAIEQSATSGKRREHAELLMWPESPQH